MGLRIGTNVQSLVGQRALNEQRAATAHELEKLSTGQRIVSAADDAAGLAISEKFKSEIRSNRQASRNTQDAISLVQVAEGGLNEVSSMLIRIRELSVQSATDTLSDVERSFTDKEVQDLKGEIGRIAESTRFNGNKLLAGVPQAHDSEGKPMENTTQTDEKTGKSVVMDGNGKPVQSEFEFQVGTGNEEKMDRIKYDLASSNSTTMALGIDNISTATRGAAQTNLDVIDKAISQVSGTRAQIGAMQNRLQSTVNNLDVYHENISAANSRIRDADVAMESAELTKRNILSQAATSTLAQANQENLVALKLIG